MVMAKGVIGFGFRHLGRRGWRQVGRACRLRMRGGGFLLSSGAERGFASPRGEESWRAFADAAFRDGEGTWAAVLLAPDGVVAGTAFSGGRCSTSEDAEIRAVLLAVDLLRSRGVQGVVFSDAQGAVRKGARLLGEEERRYPMLWVPRERNQAAHLLAAYGAAGWHALKADSSQSLVAVDGLRDGRALGPGQRLSASGLGMPTKMSVAIREILRAAGQPVAIDDLHAKVAAQWPPLAARGQGAVLSALAHKVEDGSLHLLADGRVVLDATTLPGLQRYEAGSVVRERLRKIQPSAKKARTEAARSEKRLAQERERQLQAEQSRGRSRFLKLVREAWSEDRNILFLDPILDQIGKEAPSAAQFLGQWNTALGQLRSAEGKITVVVADGRAAAVFRDDASATPAEVSALLLRCGLGAVKPPRRAVRLPSWIDRHFKRVDTLAPAPESGALLLARTTAQSELRALVPRDDFDGFLERHHLREQVQAEAEERRLARLAQDERRAASETMCGALESAAGPGRSDLGLPPLRCEGLPHARAAKLLTLREAWTLLGLEPDLGRRAAARGLIDLVRVGRHEFVGTTKAWEVLSRRDELLAPVLEEMLVAPWEAAAILGVTRRSVAFMEQRGYLAVRSYAESRRASWPLYTRGDVLRLKASLTDHLREAARDGAAR